MRSITPMLVCCLFLTAAVFSPRRSYTAERPSSIEPLGSTLPAVQCVEESRLQDNLITLKKQVSDAESFKIRNYLHAAARRSAVCRQRVIRALMNAMDQPGTELERYPLWDNGARVLAELRAVEALDLLITNLGFTDDFSISMSHYPSVSAVIDIGLPALSKLEIVLNQNPNPNMRKLAAFCVAKIGGPRARSMLKKASSRESNECVNRFLRISLEMFANKTRPNHIPYGKENSKWFGAFYCFTE